MLWRVLLLVVVGLFDLALFGKMVWGPGGIGEYRDLRNQYSSLQARISDLDAQNMALSRDIRLLQSDDKYVEKMVRQKLRYLRDNEIVYLFPVKAEVHNGATSNDSKN